MGRLILQGKGLVVSLNHVGLWSEPEGLLLDGGLYQPTNRKLHQTGEPRGLSPSGGNSAAKSLFLEYSRAPWARCGVQGVTPCREARRRAAVTPQPTCFPSSGPAPIGRGMGCRGSPPAASRRACRLTAVCIRQQTGNRTRPASRGTCCATAVKSRLSPMSYYAPAPIGRGVGCRGTTPACGGGGRRRRPGGSEGEGQREGRHPWSGCRPSERAGRRWRP